MTFLFSLLLASPQPLLLKAAHLYDGKSDALQDGVSIWVEGNRIKQIGKDLKVPEGAEVIDLGDATLLPGFIDVHTHFGYEATDDYFKDDFISSRRYPAESAHYAALHARRTLDAGFTSVRNLGGSDFVDGGVRNAINAGIIVGPRMLVSLYPLGSIGGHADTDAQPESRFIGASWKEGICTGVDQCRAAVREQVKHGADVIKVMASGGVLSLNDAVDSMQLTDEELTAIISEAHRLGRKVAAHAHGDTAARAAVRAGIDSIEHGSFLKPETLALMKQKGTYWVPTRFALDWILRPGKKLPDSVAKKAAAAMTARDATMKEALRIGVKIAFGTDAGVYPHGMNGHEFAALVKGGMTPLATLRAATSGSADLIGRSSEVGTLEVGKLADIIAVPGNPLKDITATERVSLVIKDGVVERSSAPKATASN